LACSGKTSMKTENKKMSRIDMVNVSLLEKKLNKQTSDKHLVIINNKT
jgi:hypothetical protein